MSNIYIQEPPTSGKVLLETTVGDIELELWSKECPKACRNFIQLCMENYYNNTIFHRLVPNFIVQGGDPTGTGEGGESIYGHPFKNELHSRLRFVRRGLVAMANSGKDDNDSQFFFTLAPTPELQNKHTIFGKVVGDTIYNLIRLSEGEVEDEKPVYPNKIVKTVVLVNPFSDIIPRETVQQIKKEKNSKKKSQMKGTKDFKLLSFGDEAEEDEESLDNSDINLSIKSKSSHDLLNDPKLSSETGNLPQKNKDSSKNSDHQLDNSKRKKFESEHYSSDEEYNKKLDKKKEIQQEIKKIKKDIKQYDANKDSLRNDLQPKGKKEENSLLKSFYDEQSLYTAKKAKGKGSKREDATLMMLQKFKDKLVNANKNELEKEKETLDDVDDDDDVKSDNWLSHKLTFASTDPVLAKDASTKNDDWFDIYDPRNPINKRRRENVAKKSKKSIKSLN